MKEKAAQHQLATMLLLVAQAIFEGRFTVTHFLNAGNIEGVGRIELGLLERKVAANPPEDAARPSNETLQ